MIGVIQPVSVTNTPAVCPLIGSPRSSSTRSGTTTGTVVVVVVDVVLVVELVDVVVEVVVVEVVVEVVVVVSAGATSTEVVAHPVSTANIASAARRGNDIPPRCQTAAPWWWQRRRIVEIVPGYSPATISAISSPASVGF